MTPDEEKRFGEIWRAKARDEGHRRKLPDNPANGIQEDTRKVVLMIKALCRKNMTYTQIAAKLGMPYHTVIHHARRDVS